MRSLTAFLVAIIFVGGVSLAGSGINGSDPIYTEDDYFSGGSWEMYVYSYVYDTTCTKLPGVLELDPGEMLFLYLLDVPETSGTSVEHYTVGNPDLMVINTVGFENSVVPDGYNIINFDDPYIYGYSGTAEAIIYTFFGDFMDPWCTLDPGEYSLVYYISVADAYGPVSATADSQGIGDTQSVPGPVPEPTTICLLALGGLALLRKRKA